MYPNGVEGLITFGWNVTAGNKKKKSNFGKNTVANLCSFDPTLIGKENATGWAN